DRLTGHVDPIAGHQQALEPIVGQALVEQVGEVQAQAAADGVEIEQAEHPQGLGTALHLYELATTQGRVEAAGEALETDPGWRARPAAIHVEAEVTAGDGRGKAPALEHLGKVLALQAPLVPAGATPRL